MQERHVLAIYPHPDDETFGKAGAIALYTQRGVPVTLVCATLGQMGRNMGSPFFATRESLPKIREKELRDACKILGIQDLRLLGLRDKTLEFEDREELAHRLLEIMLEIKPSLVMTYYPKHGVHPDHDALSAATIRAVAMLPENERPVVYGAPVTKNPREELGLPDVEMDVRSVLDTKLSAIRAHKSQSQLMYAQMEAELASGSEVVRNELERTLGKEAYWICKVAAN